jgi:ABC-type glycerol-3-phosphate transport system substrate-binding protein
MKKNFIKTFAAFVFAAILSCSCLTGCDSFGGRGNSNKVQFMHIWPEHATVIREIVDDFMVENPDIEIDIVESTQSTIRSSLQNLVGTSDMPDVFFWWGKEMGVWTQEDITLALDDVIAPYMDKFTDVAAVDAGKIDGHYYFAPFRTTGYPIVYNKTFFDANNITVPDTLEDFETLLKTLKDKNVTPLSTYGTGGGTQDLLRQGFYAFHAVQSGEYDDPNFLSGRLQPDDDMYTANAYALLKAKKWLKTDKFLGTVSTTEQAQKEFLEKKAAMTIINSNYIADFVAEAAKRDIEVGVMGLPAPAAIKETSYVNGNFDGFCINKETNKKEQCKKFVAYLMSDAVQQKFGRSTDVIMVNNTVTYEKSWVQQLAGVMQVSGKYDYAYDYNKGQIDNTNYNLVHNFVDGPDMSLSSAENLFKKYFENVKSAMADRMLNATPVDFIARTSPKKPYDNAWLTQGLS